MPDTHCIIIEKSKRTLTLHRQDAPSLIFPIALGRCPEGHKEREGDGRTPEGVYYICTRNEKSKFHLALGISYPNPQDADAALNAGAITPGQHQAIHASHAIRRRPPWDTPLGGFIMIHGGGTQSDWTAGCIALSDSDMDILFSLCPMETEVHILP